MPAFKKNEYNPNSNENYTEMGILETILINIACFVVLMGLFESNRYYKQIYLKRLQNRFQVTGRVPPYPSEKPFGWFLAIQKVSEEDVLQMVGLDAFMCLRFIALCQKFSIFLSFWGLVVLVPVYSTATSGPNEWNRYGISNLLSGTNDMKYRLWFSALFAYMFAAYFCQLLYAEYNNFSKRRLHFLVLSDPESLRRDDPDTPPQKYFTIMVERVPADMRSAELLRQYFDRLFPGDVYTVEVAVDILELDRKCQERKRVRDKLESAIAYYEAKNKRLQVHVPTGRIQEDSSIADGIFGKDGIVEFLGKVLAPTRFGVEPVDAIKHYTDKLLALNEEVKTLQGKSYEMTHALDSSIQHAMKHRQDTRAAAVIKNISAIAGAAASTNNSKKSKIKRMLFGQNFEEFKTTAKNTFKQMNLDDEAQEEEEEAAKTESSSHQASSSSSSSSNLKDDGFIHVQPTDTPDDIEAGNAESETHTLSPRGGDATPKSRFEEELEKVRIAGEEEMKAYTNQKENTRRPSLHTVQFQDASFADSLSTNPTTQSVDVTEKVEAKKRASLPRSKPSTLTSSRDKEIFLDAESKQSMALEKAKEVTKEGWEQTKLAGTGAVRGLIEMERGIEILLLGAYYKYATTAFITFNSRVTKAISYQMLLSHDSMEINHAPNPHDIIWDNVAIPKSQITMRSYITNIGVIIGSIFWSSLVNSVNAFAALLPLPHSQKLYASAVVMLLFLLGIPFVFDFLARYYEGMKLESEIQNSIMTRYFYYQLINVYVTVGFSGNNLWSQLISIIGRPQTLVDVIGGKLPDVSLFFCSLIIVKIFAAVPLEMIRPWQLSTIHLMGMFMDKRTTTRRDLRTGAFYSWPMLYGWIYPQLMMVLMIMTAYAVITPLLMPLCGIFFYVTYVMYKYQLLYVYINEYQSGGFMWYAVFGYSLVVMIFGSFAALGYLALQLGDANYSGPFYFLLPLPFSIMYFGKYCNGKFKKSSMNLSYSFARELDHKHQERRAQNKPTPHDTFQKALFRQPSLTEKEVFPEPYRNDGTYNILRCQTTGEEVVMSNWTAGRNVGRSGSISINVHELVDEGEENQRVLEQYFQDRVLPLATETEEEEEENDDWEDGKGKILMTRQRS